MVQCHWGVSFHTNATQNYWYNRRTSPAFSTLSAVGIHCFKALKEWNSGIRTQIIDTFAVFNEYADDCLFYTIINQPITCRCNIFTHDSPYCVCCLMSVCYEVCVALYKILGDSLGDCIFTKKPIKSTKTHFFRIFSIFVFRCMVKQPWIGSEIEPVIAIKFSGLV